MAIWAWWPRAMWCCAVQFRRNARDWPTSSPIPAAFNIPLIGWPAAESTLIRQCDVALVLPAAPEACGEGIVPTTSTTMTMALGDALAIALMEHRKFTPEHFRTFHPGGKLGAKLSRVGDLMHADMPLVPADAPMAEALLSSARKATA
jgi:arabinose-5-phosphate isomerase